MKNLIIHTDGGSRGNPGPAAIGVEVKSETGEILATISRTIGKTTNNVAEYSALIAALEWIKNRSINQSSNNPITNSESIQFFLDSTLVVNQVNGLWKMKDAHLRELLIKVRILESGIPAKISYSYIPREQNYEADVLVNKALDAKQ